MLGIGALGQYALTQFPQTLAPPVPFIRYVTTVVTVAMSSQTKVGVLPPQSC